VSRSIIPIGIALLALLGACRGGTSSDEPIVPIRNMYQQPRYTTQQASAFFSDGRVMRPPVEGTIAQEMEPDLSIQTGRIADNSEWLLEIPNAVVERGGGMPGLLARGQERFDIFCAPCHGESADGEGVVAQRAAALGAATLKPPTLHDARLRGIPDGQLYATITNGIRNMPAYGHNVPLDDRWAIVAYVRALQMSQAHRAEANQ